MLVALSNTGNIMRVRKRKLLTFSKEDRHDMFMSIEKPKPEEYHDMATRADVNSFQITVVSVNIRTDKYWYSNMNSQNILR
jgi:hypothetical protein